jgi:hypothetical protein
VHEAYVRLRQQSFVSRNHFLPAAAECMRRLPVDHAAAETPTSEAANASGLWLSNQKDRQTMHFRPPAE